ncbi:MAG: BolA family transcriptional regulator [Gammaproteobacteria bacterium]|nr:BolA family transcriptional regulator [Gammaproteobacteria bacterium]
MSERVNSIRERLSQTFQPQQLDIVDDSAAHAGHEGAKHGGHFNVYIVSDAFDGKNPIQRHRMVYHALNDLMQGEIHALSIQAKTIHESNV